MSNSSGNNGFCGDSPFFDVQMTWNSTWPHFTECFQNTVLNLVPCGWLWISSPFYLWYLVSLHRPKVLLCKLNIAKCLLICLLAVIAAIDGVRALIEHTNARESVVRDDVITPVIRSITMIYLVVLTQIARKQGAITSAILIIFWVLECIASLVPFYSKIIIREYENDIFSFVLFYVDFALVLMSLVLHCFAEKPQPDPTVTGKPCPETRCSWLSELTLMWMAPLMFLGYKRPLVEEDMYNLNPGDKCSTLFSQINGNWMKEIHKLVSSRNGRILKSKLTLIPRYMAANKLDTGLPQNTVTEKTPLLSGLLPESTENEVQQTTCTHLSLFKAIIQTFWRQILVINAWKLCCDLLVLGFPLILDLMITFTETPSEPEWKGYFYAICMPLLGIAQSLSLAQAYIRGYRLGMRVRASVIALVYRKALTMTPSSRKETTIGEIVNLMAVDSKKLLDLCILNWAIFITPIQLVLIIALIYTKLGPAVFSSVVVIILLIPVNFIVLKKMQVLQDAQMTMKDKRVKLISEILNGIKILKLYGWEQSFMKKVDAIRKDELVLLLRGLLINAFSILSWTIAPTLVSLASFLTYIYTSDDHYLSPDKAFVSITYMNILRVSVYLIPIVISDIVKAAVSLRRLDSFFSNEDIDPNNVHSSEHQEEAVIIENGTFQWDAKLGPCLKNVSLSFPQGKLIAVVGQVGCGKSSLASAILGDMERLTGNVTVKGRIAYVPQEAWIQNATVRDNITFGNEFQTERYNKVLDACALRQDLDILVAHDMTEIGEKGINLSGGQKQRVSLARAVYNEADIYLLDDPLSAVDAHVGKHIFDQVISDDGLLKSKTRILVTHGVHWLPKVDQIIVIVDGAVTEIGSYEELLANNGAFAQFLRTYLIEHMDESATDDDDVQAVRGKLLEILLPVHSGDEREDVGNQRMSLSQSLVASLRTQIREEPSQTDKLIDEETAQIGGVRTAIYMTYLKATTYWRAILMVVFYALNQACVAGGSIWLQKWTDDQTLANMSISSDSAEKQNLNNMYIGIYSLFGGLQALFIFAFSIMLAFTMVRGSRNLHQDMLRNVLKSPMSFFDTTPVGRIINRFSRDIDSCDEDLPNNFSNWLSRAFPLITTVVIISINLPIFLAVIAPLIIIYYFLQKFYITTSRQLKRVESNTRSPIFSHFSETLSGVAVIRSYRQQDRFIKTSDKRVDNNDVFYIYGQASNRWLGVVLDLLGNAMLFGTAMFSVAKRNTMTAGVMGLTISYAQQLTTSLTYIVRASSDIETNIVSVERIVEYCNTPREAPWEISEFQLPSEWPSEGMIHFQNYTTRYRAGLNLILKGITADIKGGEKVGIVGRTGAGKSSLMLSLFRIIESASGRIEIDGRNIADMGLHDLRKRLTILPQDPVLFSGSLRMNLDPFDAYSDDAIWIALDHAHLKNFVTGLPDQLQYQCGEGGLSLSVGQRQLLCLARSLLRKTKILVLDEATAAVDMESDDLIQQTIRKEFKDCTIVTIAHRLNTIMDYDRILVIQEGLLKEYDSPNNLLQDTSSEFYGMARNAGLVKSKNV